MILQTTLQDFIREYFVNPMLYPDSYAPYNAYNTAAYAVLALIAAYFIYRLLEKYGIEVDEKFFHAVLSFVAFGSVLRVVTDAGILPRVVEVAGIQFFPFITPGIYVLVFLIVISVLAVTKFVFRASDFKKTSAKIGWAFTAIAFLPLLAFAKNNALVLAVPLLAGIGVLALIAADKLRNKQSEFLEKTTVFAQSLDGAATFVGVQFAGYAEQHVLGNAIFDAFGGPWAFYATKIAFGILVVNALRGEPKNQRNFVLLLITIFGFGPGTRDSLRTWLGV